MVVLSAACVVCVVEVDATAAGVGPVGSGVVCESLWCGYCVSASEVCDCTGGCVRMADSGGVLADTGVVRTYGTDGNLSVVAVCEVGACR